MSKKKSYKSSEPCVVTGECRDGYVCYHHLITRKARPDLADKTWNKIPVSQETHQLFHSKGITWMAGKHAVVRWWLMEKGWGFDDVLMQWSHPGQRSDASRP